MSVPLMIVQVRFLEGPLLLSFLLCVCVFDYKTMQKTHSYSLKTETTETKLCGFNSKARAASST